MGWYILLFLLVLGLGVWLAFAYMSWKQSRTRQLKRRAKLENRHLRRK